MNCITSSHWPSRISCLSKSRKNPTNSFRIPGQDWTKRCVSALIPEEEHVVRVEAVDDAALLLQGQHADVQLPGVEEVQYQLDHLGLLDADCLLCRHDFRSLVAAHEWLEMQLVKLHKKE